MKVLLSIKPQYAEAILSGRKRYEYRRAIFKRPGVQRVVIYASAPVRYAGPIDPRAGNATFIPPQSFRYLP